MIVLVDVGIGLWLGGVVATGARSERFGADALLLALPSPAVAVDFAFLFCCPCFVFIPLAIQPWFVLPSLLCCSSCSSLPILSPSSF